jgi:hypothetical protein
MNSAVLFVIAVVMLSIATASATEEEEAKAESFDYYDCIQQLTYPVKIKCFNKDTGTYEYTPNQPELSPEEKESIARRWRAFSPPSEEEDAYPGKMDYVKDAPIAINMENVISYPMNPKSVMERMERASDEYEYDDDDESEETEPDNTIGVEEDAQQ